MTCYCPLFISSSLTLLGWRLWHSQAALHQIGSRDRDRNGSRLRSCFGHNDYPRRAFLRPSHTALHVDVEGRLIQEDAVDPEIHVRPLPLANPTKALLYLLLAIPIHRLELGLLKRQVALRPHEVITVLLETLNPSNL